MPKATRAKTENETPKKRNRKANPAEGNGTEAADPVTTAPAIADTTSEAVATGIAASSASQSEAAKETPKKRSSKAKFMQDKEMVRPLRPAPAIAGPASEVAATEHAASPAPQRVVVPEELVRRRAYEIYLRRRGQGGSPEQDWFQALQEISGQHVA
jgi:hypothetical protein